jgi:hypothetical protein
MMEAVSSSETSVNIYHNTRYNIPEDSHLYTHRCENMISHSITNHRILQRRYSLDQIVKYKVLSYFIG